MATIARVRAAELLAQLADPVRLAVTTELGRRTAARDAPATVAQLAEALDLPVRPVADAVARLTATGIVAREGSGYVAHLATLREAAADLDAENPLYERLDRFPRLRGCFSRGRLVTLPDLELHGHDLALLIAELIAFDGLVDEAEMNRRLAVFSDDVALLRRLLVDEGMVVRDAAGTAYEML